MTAFYCPVCWGFLFAPTPRNHIAEHLDSVGLDVCPMSGESFRLAGVGRPQRAPADRTRRRVTAADRVSTSKLNQFELFLERTAA